MTHLQQPAGWSSDPGLMTFLRSLSAKLTSESNRTNQIIHNWRLQIMGNVAPGASVKAGGDIIVLGRLAGTAYAGAGGNPDAVVVALTMEPALIGINNRIFSGPDGGASPYPEVASVSPSGAIW